MSEGNAGSTPLPVERQLKASGALLVVAMIWGSMVPFTSALLEVFDPFALASLRYVVGIPFCALFLLIIERGPFLKGPLPWRRIFLLGGPGMGGFALCYTLGIGLSGPVVATTIIMCQPLIASLMTWAMYRTPFERGFFLALGLSVIGGIVVVWFDPNRAGGLEFRGGEPLMILCQCCWTWYSLKNHDWLGRAGMSPLRITLLTSIACMIWLIGFYVILLLAGYSAPPPLLNLEQAGMLVWVAMGGIAIAVVLWNFGQGAIGVPLATMHLNLIPVVSIGLAVAIFGARLDAMQIIGAAVVLAGVLLIQIRRLRAATRAREVPLTGD